MKRHTKKRWPKELLLWRVTVPVNASLVNSKDRRIAKSHLVFEFEAYSPADAFERMNYCLAQLIEEAAHNQRVWFMPFRRAIKKKPAKRKRVV